MLQQKEFEYDGNKYLATAFPAMKGLSIQKQLIKLVGPAFMAMSGEGNILDSKTASQMAMEALVEGMDKVEVESLVRELVSSVSKGNTAINFDMEFSAAYDKLYFIVWEVIQLNFGSLFRNGGFVGGALSKMQAQA